MSTRSGNDPANRAVLNQPSETAMATATLRAFAAFEEREEIRGPDYLAEFFLSKDRKAPLKDPAARQWVLKNKVRPGAYELMIARTAFFDEVVNEALVNQLPQLVLLGAGYDSRPYRFGEMAQKTKIFELDATPTQQRKKEVLELARIPIPLHLTFVSIDFSTDNLADRLIKHGFSVTEKTLFVWEGVMYYLSREAVDHMFEAVKSIATAGSEICFDYAAISPEALNDERTRKLRDHMKSEHAGEPARFGIPSGTISNFLAERGYQLIENLDASAMEARYLTLRDGSTVGNVPALFALARAQVLGN